MDVRVSISSSCMTRARPTPPTLSRCAPLTRHGPELTASICQVAVEVPSLVVGICALGTMSWNTHQNTQPLRCNCYKTRFILLALCCSPIYIYLSRCAPLTRHGPELTASICQVAVEVPSLVVGICALGRMSWNTHQNTQPLRCNCYKTRFILSLIHI